MQVIKKRKKEKEWGKKERWKHVLCDEEDLKATEENAILSTLWLKRANTSGQEAGQFRANGNVETSQTGRQRPKAGRAAQ